MKLSSSISVLLFSLLSPLFSQQNSLSFSYAGSRATQNLENNLSYQLAPFRNSLMQIKGFSLADKRISFSQYNRHSVLELDLNLVGGMLDHTVSAGYEYLYDSSELEDMYQPYNNKTGFLGYALRIVPLDSLALNIGTRGYIRSEEDRYSLDNVLRSDGYQMMGKVSARTEIMGIAAHIGAEYEQKKLNWEYFHSLGMIADLNYQSDNLLAFGNFMLNQRDDDLFVLEPDESDAPRGSYSRYDSQQRSTLTANADLEYHPWEKVSLTLQESYNRRVINLEQNTIRNNSDFTNIANVNLAFAPYTNVRWITDFNHGLAIKEFKYTQNTRHTESRSLSSSLAWDYLPGDTLSTSFSIDLQRTSYPDAEHNWDNDLRNIRFRLRAVHYLHDRVKLSGNAAWSISDDVYIDGVLSNNNNQKNSLVFSPECAILIGDRMLFNQTYSLRADYTSYQYEAENKAFYRQLGVEYKFVFDSFPLIARSSDLLWIKLPYRNKNTGSALLSDISFAIERNEYADYNGSVYEINFKNTRYTAGFTLKHDIRDMYYVLKPRFSWGTWTEYSLLAGFAWKATNNSLLEISVNPTGNSLDDLDWRTALSLSAYF